MRMGRGTYNGLRKSNLHVVQQHLSLTKTSLIALLVGEKNGIAIAIDTELDLIFNTRSNGPLTMRR